jgi:hypothetical protein
VRPAPRSTLDLIAGGTLESEVVWVTQSFAWLS